MQLVSINKLKNNNGQVEGLPKNPRLLKDDKFKKLVKSIQDDPEMLELREVIAYDNNGELIVIAGNMRLKACQEVGIKEIPTKILPKETSVEKLKAYTIKDNVAFGEHDWDELANSWDVEQLTEWGLDIPNFDANVLEAEEDDFAVPDGGSETDIVLGDLFEIGEHRLLCGDSTDSDQVAKLMNGQKADMLFTDPPYNVGFNGRSGKFDVIENDDLKTEDFDKFIEEFAQTVHTLQIPIKYIWCNWKFYGTLQKHFELNACIVWAKNVFGLGRGYRHQHEFCFFEGKLDEGINNESDLWEIKKDSKYMHPTQKPIELSARALGNHKNANNILDLFGGSGSTLAGIHQLKRVGYIMELDPKYCQVIVDRMKLLDPSLVIKKNGVAL
jgi:site-specific DNA-methyltransferase (adenine-specific)